MGYERWRCPSTDSPLSVIQVCCDVRTPVPVVRFITQKSQKSLPVFSFHPISAPWASCSGSARSENFLSSLSLCCRDDGERLSLIPGSDLQ